MDEMDPKQFRTYKDIPPPIKDQFKPVEGGFVKETAIINPGEAMQEAWVERNVLHLNELLKEKLKEVERTIFVTENVIKPINAHAEQLLTEQRQLYVAERHKLEPQKIIAEKLLRKFNIHQLVDRDFLAEVAIFAELWYDASAENRSDPTYQARESQFMAEALERLRLRQAKEQYEKGGAIVDEIHLSQDRKLKMSVSERGDGISFEFTPFHGFENVEIGPDAVTKILGAKLTEEDYRGIAEKLLLLRGPIGDVARKYAEAVRKWARRYEAREDDSAERGARSEAAFDFVEILQYRRLGPYRRYPYYLRCIL